MLYEVITGTENLPAILAGSHLDSVKQGGNYDGVLGVLTAMEAVETIVKENIPHNRITSYNVCYTKLLRVVVWVIGIMIVWEIGATIVAGTKRSPENVLPHLHQIVESIFSSNLVNGTQTAFQIVLSNAGT